MANYRKLPSGLWQAAVRVPTKTASGQTRRLTKTHPLKGVLREWATDLEAKIAAGTWNAGASRDSEITLAAWRELWLDGRLAAGATTRKNDSHWRNHIEPVFGGHPLALITRAELRSWVGRMHGQICSSCRQTPGVTRGGQVLVKHKRPSGHDCAGSGKEPGLGAWTIQGCVAHLSAMLAAAVEDGRLPANPAAGLKMPRADAKPVFYWTRDEAQQLLLVLGATEALMVDLDLHTGLRLGELLGLRRRWLDTDRWLIQVVGVQTRDGWREYPKSRKSRRAVPVPPHLRDQLWLHVAGLESDDHVFRAPGGGAWDDRNFSRRVFDPAVEAAGIRRGTPHDMRHTAASWLVQDGVNLYRVQALLGHEKYSTTERYAHLAPDAFDEVVNAWTAARPLDPRTALEQPSRTEENHGR